MKQTHTIIEEGSTRGEWEELRAKLAALTDEQVREIAKRVGLEFTNPNSSPTKGHYIDILDEAYWDELAEAYERLAIL
jgi:hypothetical protein